MKKLPVLEPLVISFVLFFAAYYFCDLIFPVLAFVLFVESFCIFCLALISIYTNYIMRKTNEPSKNAKND